MAAPDLMARRPTLEQTPSNPHVNADLDPLVEVEAGSADPKPTSGEQTKQLPPFNVRSSGEQSKQLPPLFTSVQRESHSNPALSSPLDPLTPANLHSPPAIVLKSQWEANAELDASSDPRAVQEKNEMENELHSKVAEVPATSESPTSAEKKSFLDMLGFTKA